MIQAVHTLMYSDDAPATRAFLRDVLQWPCVGGESENDWLIFQTGPSEMGVHPTSGEGYQTPRHHEIALLCDDLGATMAELAGRGATFSGEPTDRGFGMAVHLQVPGADDILLYQPRHEPAWNFRTPDMGVVPPTPRF